MPYLQTSPIPSLPSPCTARRVHRVGRYTSVFEGECQLSGDAVAIKVLTRAPSSLQEQLIQRLNNEGEILSLFSHPAILPCRHNGAFSTPAHLVTQWINGGTLLEELERSGPMIAVRALNVMLGILDALQVLHNAGIVHRDIKPENILLRGEQAVLCDFGIAQYDSAPRLTMADSAMGSLPFMAPEQRVDARKSGPQSDLYGVGCTLYQLLTGWSPYNLFMAAADSPRWAPLPAPISAILFRATRAQPEQRYKDSTEMATAILHVMSTCREDMTVRLNPPSPPTAPPTLPLHASGASGLDHE